MESRSALFVFLGAFCHSAFLPLLPHLEEWHCVSGSHFTLTRLIDRGDGSEKIPHQCETLPWFRLSRDPWSRVTGTVGIFLHPSPLLCSARFLSSVAPCHSHVGLHHVCRPSHTIPALLRAEAALRAQHFHPTTLRMSRPGRG